MAGSSRSDLFLLKLRGYVTNRGTVPPIAILLSLFLLWLGVSLPNSAAGAEKPVVAVLPFRVYAPAKLAYLKKGLQKMFAERLDKEGVKISDLAKTELLASSYPSVDQKSARKLGQLLSSGFVIDGSVTQMGKRLSLDLKLFDLRTRKPPFFMYGVAEDMGELAGTVKQLVNRIYNRISGVMLVESVEVAGNKRIEKDAILAVIQTKKGDRLNYDNLDRDLREVYKMGYFKDVKIETEEEANGVKVIFHVSEKPSIGKIVFKGNKKFKDKDLRKELGLKQYSILDQTQVKQSVNRLKDFYRQKGYYNAEIKEKTEPLSNNEVALEYTINEENKVYIYKIEFLGNEAFSDKDLAGLMETKTKGFFSWITDSGYLDKKKLDFDVQKVAAYYHNHGYINARVGTPEIEFTKGKGLKIIIEIEEGDQYGVGKVSVQGDLIEPEAKLMKIVRIDKEKEFNREILRKDMLAIRNLYADEGYAYADVAPLIKEDAKLHKVDITYKISMGPKVRFGRITITGNTVTRDKVIRREIKAIPGNFFSGKAVRKSMEDLNRLGFFEKVSVQTKPGAQKKLMNLDIQVKERPTGFFNFGVGYSSQDKEFVSFQIAQNNLLGNGESLSATARLGAISNQFDISFVEPWLLDKPLSLGVDLYKWMQEYSDYTINSTGFSTALGFPLGIDEYTRGSVKYNLDNSDISNVASTASYAIRDMIGENLTSSVTVGIARDSRDRPFNTHRGSINSISYEYAGGPLGGDLYFDKYLARSAWYFPLPWNTVFLAQGRWGYVVKRPGGKLPVFQKFAIGGMDTVRGFDYGAISPRDPVTGDLVGGTKMMCYNFEYRFPLSKSQGVVGVVFYDAGNVFAKDEPVTFSGIRDSVGAGVRWYSPVGPLIMEYGKNLHPRSGEPPGRWEFTVGGLF